MKEGKNAGTKDGDLKMAEKNNILDIIRGISQAASHAYDGTDSDGERVQVGLKREEGHLINDNRVMDGFGVKFHGDKLIVTYHSEVSMKEIHARGPKRYEEEVEAMFGDITSFLKKEYKKVTGKSLTLKSLGEAKSLIQRMSGIRNWVQSQKTYEIGGLTGIDSVEPEKKTIDENIRSFLSHSKKSLLRK